MKTKSAKLPKSKLLPLGTMVSAKFVVTVGEMGTYRQAVAKVVGVSNDKYGCAYKLRVMDFTPAYGECPSKWTGHVFEVESTELD